MGTVDPAVRDLLEQFAAIVRRSRRARRWSIRRLALEAGMSHSYIVRLEHGDVSDLSFRRAELVLKALDGRLQVRFLGLASMAPPQRDRAHARCVAYVARRLGRAGLLIATEVDVGGASWHGFADVLAFDEREHVLLAIEVKTEIHDLGELDRQIGVVERGAWQAAHARGWRPRAVMGVLLVLATEENDGRLQENRAHFDQAYRLRSRVIQDVVQGDRNAIERAVGRRGERGVAMIDPATRRRTWILPTRLDGRRTSPPYADRAAYLAGQRSRPRRGSP
jgi:transcriptional regulator with XRE-family HTH domain